MSKIVMLPKFDSLDHAQTVVRGALQKVSDDATKLPTSFNNQRLQNLADPTSSTDAATKNYVDSLVVNLPTTQDVQTLINTRTPALTDTSVTIDGTPVSGATISTSDFKGSHIDAKMFGARGDGVSDDTAILSAAILIAQSLKCPLFIPAGTYIVTPNTTNIGYILPQPSNVWIYGAGEGITILKVKDSSGSYVEFFGPAFVVVSNFILSDLTIDQNSSNNPIPSAIDFHDNVRDILHIGDGGGNMRIDHVEFLNLDCSQVIYYGTPYTTISNCKFRQIGNTSWGDHDHSSIYSGGEHTIISNNYWSGYALGSNGAHTAIETHCSYLNVIGNVIIDMLVGINITSEQNSNASTTANGETRSVNVIGNSVSGCFYGLWLVSNQYLTHTTGYGLHGVNVSGNTFRVNQLAYFIAQPTAQNSPCGILFQPNANLHEKNILISNNIIEFDLEVSVPVLNISGSCIGIGYWDATNSNLAEQVTISNNIIINAPAMAIRFESDGNDIFIHSNLITNPGSSPGVLIDSYRTGIEIANHTSNPFSNLNIFNNVIQDTQATSKMKFGITILATNNTAGGVTCKGNVISATGTNVSSLAFTHAIYGGVPYIEDYEWVPFSATTLIASGSGVNLPCIGSTIMDTFRGVRMRYDTGSWISYWLNNKLLGTTTAGAIHATNGIIADISLQSPTLVVWNPLSFGSLELRGSDALGHIRFKGFLSDAETGSGNTGANYYIARYTDAGAFIASAFEIVRSTGNVLLFNPGNTAAGAAGSSILTTDATQTLTNKDLSSATNILPTSAALTGDVTKPAGSNVTTVALVAASTAANVHAAEVLANAATNANTFGAIVQRDGSGSFSGQVITGVGSIVAGTANGQVHLIAGTTSNTGYIEWKNATTRRGYIGDDTTDVSLHLENSSSFKILGGPAFLASPANTTTAITTIDGTQTITNKTIDSSQLVSKSGSNKRVGTGTLVGGTLAISNTSITVNSQVFVQDTGGGVIANIGSLYIASQTVGVGFTVTSSNILDTSTFRYWIFETN
jgi:hypothetical protein